MSADPTTAAKLCTVCGIDCAGKPRIKDQQGRYICKDCFDRAKQTRQVQKSPPQPAPAVAAAPSVTAAIPSEGDNSFLLSMGSKESTGTAGTKPCPECGRAMPANAVICIGCGFNTGTGKRHMVKVIKAKKEAGPKEKGASRGAGIFDNGPLMGGIVFAIYALSGAALFFDPAIAGMAYMLAGLIGLVIWIVTVVAAFNETSGWGWGCIFPLIALIWAVFVSDDPRLKWLWGCHILGSITQYAIIFYFVSAQLHT